MKRILILTAGYGEGHNSAARGLQAGLARVSPETAVECHDLFAETLGWFNNWVRKGYLTLINKWPRSWGLVYDFLDRKTHFDKDFDWFRGLKHEFAALLARFQPDVVVSVFPPYPYILRELQPNRAARNIVVVTDSITVNSIWYHSDFDALLVPNDQSAAVVERAGVAPEKIGVFGFPVNPRFADLPRREPPSARQRPRVLYMINAGTSVAPDIARRLAELPVDLTVTVGRDEKLRRQIESATAGHNAELIGWSNELPELLCRSHVLVGKAGGATVQETIAAGCPMIINHVVSGQEEGNAQLIVQTRSGTVEQEPARIAAQVERLFENNAALWHEWSANIAQLSRPRASLDIANYLLSL
jgi:processive 1,2-diacylglycerol beta-glucosyltransferase